jgi:hypothetical protein
MSPNEAYDEATLARLLRLLPPAAEAWVTAARELRRADRGLAQVLALAEADAEFRPALIDELEEALCGAGFEPGPTPVRDLRERLGDGNGDGG